jgi:maleylpyruvate isomerase
MLTARQCAQIRADIGLRTIGIVEALSELDEQDLAAPSGLRGWSRLTIACHLRYGAEALSAMSAMSAMTEATRSGRSASFYPEGRAHQRPHTLRPNKGEPPGDVSTSLARSSDALSQLWSTLTDEDWNLRLREPVGNPDLGPVTLSRLALLRLTEVQVHGSDLGLTLNDWSPLFIELALPMRLDRRNVRNVDQRTSDLDLEGSWLLVALDGPTYLFTAAKGAVECAPASPTTPARATVEATSRDLLALLLGRPFSRPPRITGDVAFWASLLNGLPRTVGRSP